MEALKFNTPGEFKKKRPGAYRSACRRKILQKICRHMKRVCRSSWTYEELINEALKYSSRSEFNAKSKGAYLSAFRRNILDKICSHMPEHIYRSGKNSPHYKWTYEMLKTEALKYKTRSELQKKNPYVYQCAYDRNLIDELCSHMEINGNLSLAEKELFSIIESKYPTTRKLKDRRVSIPNKPHVCGFDIDIFVPEVGRGIEFDGIYWHSPKGLKRSREHWPKEDLINYHKIKDSYFLSKGVELLHINEKDWINDKKKCIEDCLIFLGRS